VGVGARTQHTSTLYLLVGIMFIHCLMVGVLEDSEEDIRHVEQKQR